MFETWADRIATVTEAESQRALLAEIAVWRARRLTEVPATRQGTWALARLHQLLGEKDKAIQEARQLVSLCQTPPLASREESAAARKLLTDLGVKAPKLPALESTRSRTRAPRSERPAVSDSKADPVAQARAEAQQGRTRNVRKLAADRRGGVWTALRSWSVLTDGLEGDEATLRKAVETVRAELAGLAGIRQAAPSQAPAAAQELTSGPLVELIGRALPHKRRAALSVVDGFLREHPEQLDALTALMLDHHIQESGPGASAGWLSGLVARALVAGGEATKQKLAALQKDGTAGVALFDALPFHRGVRLGAAAIGAGWAVDGLREGVLSRGEPADRKVWTLRVSDAAGQRMLAIAPHATEPWPGTLASDIAARIAQLAPSAVLLATGVGNAALREAAEGGGISCLEEDADDAVLLETLAAREAIAVRERSAPSAAPVDRTERQPSPPDQLTALLAGSPSEEEIAAVVATFRRPSSALRVAERAEASLDLAPALLRSVHAASDPGRGLPEGTTLAVRAAAAGNAEARALLTEGDTAARFGGVGAGAAADVGAVLVRDGWELFRVLRGTTRRERERQPVLETLGEALDGLWRLLIRKGDVKGEVWFLAELGPEGRAGVPQLLQEAHQRAVVIPLEPELLSWYGELGGPEAIGWTDDAGGALTAAVAGWSA